MKAFISHSSKQKPFVEELTRQIGHENCIIDAYDFSPAFKTMDEIVEKIDNASIFIFLVSRESLESDWCEEEIRYAKDKIVNSKFKLFLPYIIDSSIDLETVKSKYEWIVSEDTYNLKLFRSPLILSKDLELKFRILERRRYREFREGSDIFTGRNKEIEEFQEKKRKKRKSKALVISGRRGTGRHHFCNHCASINGFTDKFFLEKIDLPENGALAELISQLNTLTGLYSSDNLIEILRAEESVQIDCAVDLLNEVYTYQGRILINDEDIIVDYKSDLKPWFSHLIQNERLKSMIGLFIVSTSHMKALDEINNQNVIAIRIPDFSEADRQKILVDYIEYFRKSKEIEYTDDDILYFVQRLQQSPSQLVQIAEIIVNHGVGEAKRNVQNLRNHGDYILSEILNRYRDNDIALDFLTLLAQPGMMSYDDIKNVYKEEYDKIKEVIDELIIHSLVYETGVSSSVLKVDTAVGDYLVRIKRTIPDYLKKNLNDYLRASLPSADTLAESPSLYMMTCKQALNDGRVNVEDLLLPSIAMNYLIKLYHSGNQYEKVISFARHLLDGNLTVKLGDDLKQEILFWECLSYSHLRDKDRFYDRLTLIQERADKLFLKGFFKNKSEDFDGAINDLSEALKLRPGMNKAKREIVTSYMKLRKFDDALKYAKENYMSAPENSYHIIAYFQCLLFQKKRTPDDEKIMDTLISYVQNSFLQNKEELEAGMIMMRKVRVPRPQREELYTDLLQLEKDYPGSNFIRDVVSSCRSYLNK